ncbi:MAG: choice-of-anchor D domain-containing protein [Calditrichae bacterium]|nr:choice-of-anchor D domain-containing protein [Calditrichia bacterium]
MFHATVHPAPRALIFLLFLVFSTFVSATDVFINEIHYDNDGTDIGEGVEIAGPAGTDLSGWQIVLYNGATGASYGTINLSGVIADQDNGFGTLAFFRAGIQNGDPDGLALVDDLGNVIQFLSYDGEFTATNGPATGLPSTDIIVNEPTTSPVGESLQLGGNGTIYENFSWNPAAAETFGSINNSQSFVAAAPAPNIAVSPLAIDFGTVEIGNAAGPATITVSNTGTAELTVSAISDPGGEFVLTNVPVLSATIPAGSSVSFDANYLPTDAGADNATITISSDDPDSPTIEIQLSGEGTAPPPAVPVVINEVDSDQDGTDMAEFVELFDGGTGNTDLSGLVLVFFNGTSDVSYAAYDLDGFSTNAAGYFVAGNAAVPNADLIFNNNFLQNGADAIAIFAGDAADFPNGTPVSTVNLIDAMVYDTDDADDTELLALLNAGQPQINENGNGNAIGESMQRIPNGSGGARNSDTYALFAPTPGSENGVSVGTEPDIAVSPTAIDFGQITLGANAATTVTIHNNGSADLNVSAISDPGGAFAIANLPTLTAIISPGNTATFDVTFSPSAIGATAASINISSDDPDSPIVEIQLTGEGIDNSPPPAQDFVLLANERINIEKFSSIHGNIHSNDKVEIEKGRNGVIYGNISAVESIEIEKRNTVDGDVISPETDIDGMVNGSILEESVDAVPMPQLSEFSSGNTDIYVRKRSTKILLPGSYDDIEVGDRATLQLSSGDYFAEDLTLQSRAKLLVDVSGGPVNIYLEEDLQLDERAEVEISGGSTADFTVFCGDDRNIKIREKAIMRGNLIAPNATVKLEDDSYFKGSIVADRISIEKNVVIVSHSATILPKSPQATEEIAAVPETFELRQNYPNPFNPTTTIQFGLPVDAMVSLNIYNARGQLVKALANGTMPAGVHQIAWNGTDEGGTLVASGMYFYMLQSGDFRETRRMILLK